MADQVENVGTERIGQLTGVRDPEHWILRNVTRPWGVEGVDLGANTEHNGRLYIFFGDVATGDNGEHQPEGWNFFLPNDHQGATDATGQPDWRFCSRCRGLFWAPGGDPTRSVCPVGGPHHAHPESWTFYLPNDHQGATDATGQPDWRFCGKCRSLFWAPGDDVGVTVCPAGDTHEFPRDSRRFYLPNDHQGASEATGQGGWRFCGKCHGLAWRPADPGLPTSVCPAGNPRNADLVAWTDDPVVTRPTRGTHEAIGWTFILPNDHQPRPDITGQPDWRFCGKCLGLFWAPRGDASATTCPAGDCHDSPSDSWHFFLPNDHQGATDATGQRDWRFCDRCHGLFFAPGSDVLDWGTPERVVLDTVCPAGGVEHAYNPQSWLFFLPNREFAPAEGQPEWRFCRYCHGLFWNGDPNNKGVCPAVHGGGITLHPVTRPDSGEFDPLAAQWPIGVTKSLEAPGGAFSHNGRAYVFVNISPERWSEHQRPGNPMYGTYLVSKDDPSRPGPYRTDFLFSPRVGACPVAPDGAVRESHQVLGLEFILPHDLDDGVPRQRAWRRCTRCLALFLDSDGDGAGGRCWGTGGGHVADGPEYALPISSETETAQGKWYRCDQCDCVFWTGDPASGRGHCAADGDHRPTGPELAMPYRVARDNPNQFGQWRFCVKCAGLFCIAASQIQPTGDRCPQDGGQHEPAGHDFTIVHDISENASRQANWRHCHKCAGMFWNGDGGFGTCPAGGLHELTDAAHSLSFVLAHSRAEDDHNQTNWRSCGKCAGLFWAGHPTQGVCPADHRGHQAGAGPAAPGLDFALRHDSDGDDFHQHEGGWRFCVRCSEMVWTGKMPRLSGVAPRVVRTADHPFLPDHGAEEALLMVAFGFAPNTAFRLAYLPLRPGADPALLDTRYYTGLDEHGVAQWSPDDGQARDLFTHDGYTSVSVRWLPELNRWLMLYSNAHDGAPDAFARPAVARIAPSPMEWETAKEIPVFTPSQAYGRYMHKHDPYSDDIDRRLPPGGDDHNGWPYGLHILDRYTSWDGANRVLHLYYLLSTSSPYQVHLMHTALQITT